MKFIHSLKQTGEAAAFMLLLGSETHRGARISLMRHHASTNGCHCVAIAAMPCLCHE